MSLVLQSSSGGQITIQEPTTASNFTQTLPAVNGTIITTGNIPTGSVLQVVNAIYSTVVTNSTNTYADTGLSASITPTSASSKILAIVEIAGCSKSTGTTYMQLRLVRNSTTILYFEGIAAYTANASYSAVGGSGCNYLDSPATTSATTYKVQFASGGNVALVTVNDYGAGINISTSTITLMEIAA